MQGIYGCLQLGAAGRALFYMAFRRRRPSRCASRPWLAGSRDGSKAGCMWAAGLAAGADACTAFSDRSQSLGEL